MPSATTGHTNTNMPLEKVVQLIYLCSLLYAVNRSSSAMRGITYTSGNPDNDRILTPSQTFLCKLAQICDTTKGGDTITALVALKGANGPNYYFASNNRKDMELKDTKRFLGDLLDYVGKGMEKTSEKALQKQVLWRALEFNFPRVDFYIRRVVATISECINLFDEKTDTDSGSDIVPQLKQIEKRAKFPRDMLAGQNAKPKFLSDCETLIKAIQFARDNGFNRTIEERAKSDNPDIAEAWCQLRHFFGRLHSYRQAAERIVKAAKDWPELFAGFTIDFVPSGRLIKFSMPRPIPDPRDVIQTAFPEINVDEYSEHLEELRRFKLDENIKELVQQKSIKRTVHCEVLLQDFLVRNKHTDEFDYWNNSKFIATSKPPCRLCHYYFSDPDNDFQVQSSHMNAYPKWRLPDVYKGQDLEDVERQKELLDDIIEQMQQDTLRIVKEKLPQGKRNDSRTESRLSTMGGYAHVDRKYVPTRNSGPFSGMDFSSTQESSYSEESLLADESEFEGVGESQGVALSKD